MSYYGVALLVAIPLYRRDRGAFLRAKDALVVGYTVTYALYIALPAKGPASVGIAEPAMSGLAAGARWLVDALSVPDPRQSFPSGHAATAAIVAFILWRERLGVWARVGIPLCVAIVVSTLYLRYHYLVDVLAGFAVAAVALIACRRPVTMADRP